MQERRPRELHQVQRGRDSVREGGLVAGIGEGVSFGVGEREGATLGAAGGLVVGKPGAGGLLSTEGEPAGTAGGVGSEDGGGEAVRSKDHRMGAEVVVHLKDLQMVAMHPSAV